MFLKNIVSGSFKGEIFLIEYKCVKYGFLQDCMYVFNCVCLFEFYLGMNVGVGDQGIVGCFNFVVYVVIFLGLRDVRMKK